MISNSRKICVLDFGEIPAGSFSIRKMKLKNNSKEKQTYEIVRDSETNPLDYVFEVEPQKMVMNPGESIDVKVQYAPEIPFYTHFDNFHISDSTEQHLEIRAQGKSTGPNINIPSTQITFTTFTSPLRTQSVKTLLLRNDSNIETCFQFDVDVNQCVFKPDVVSGNIGPHKRLDVKFRFSPTTPGLYTKEIFCFIHYQKPRIFKLRGICLHSKLNKKNKPFNIIYYSHDDNIKPEKTKDVIKEQKSCKYLIVRPSHLDFGQTDVPCEGELGNSLTFSVSNKTTKDVLLIWDRDVKNIFRVEPTSSLIPKDEFVMFKAFFHPKQSDLLLNIELEARGYWNEASEKKSIIEGTEEIRVYMPINVSLKMMGHSFSKGSYGFLPQYRVCPKNVMMPACIPPISVSRSFLIERFGHLPIMFRFTPPLITHFQVSPMLGIIDGAYQIVVVEMNPDLEEDKTYSETWTVQFNGSSSHEVSVNFCGFAENPVLKIGQDNTVFIPTTFRGAEHVINVLVRNISRHCTRIEYDFGPSSDILTNITEGNVIGPNETVCHKWQYMPVNIGIQSMQITIKSTALQACKKEVGDPFTTAISVLGNCEVADLVAFPGQINFGMVQYQDHTSHFHLYNFSNCPIHFQLECIQRGIYLEQCTSNITLDPETGTVAPNSHLKVNVKLSPTALGLQTFSITYNTKRNRKSKVLANHPTVWLVDIDYEGMLPLVHIQDLKFEGAGPLFTKVCLWNLMDINRLNDALNKCLPNTKEEMRMNFPEASVGSKPFTAYLYLQNNCFFDSEWNIKKRKRICSCKPYSKYGLLCNEDSFHCHHEDIITLRPTSGKLKPGESQVLKLVVKYQIEGTWEVDFKMELTYNRKILMKTQIKIFTDTKPVVSTYTAQMNLLTTFVGDIKPTIQMFWLYNNSLYNANYELGTQRIKELTNDSFDVQVLTCLNPKGIVKSKDNNPIYFKFTPSEFKNYEVTLPLNVEGEQTNLRVCGEGVAYFDTHLRFLHHKIPTVTTYKESHTPINLSSDHIIVKPFPTNSLIERIVYIENQTDQPYGFKWHEYNLEPFLRATVDPLIGTLYPKEAAVCKIILESNNEPCILTARLHVETVNYAERRKHIKSVIAYKAVEDQMAAEFTILEKGPKIQSPNIEIYPMPESIDLTLAVTCHIHNPIDIDVKFKIKHQQKQQPSYHISTINEAKQLELNNKEKLIVQMSLENIIWDTINSKWFEKMMNDVCNENKPYYAQFLMSQKKRASLTKKTFNIPPLYVINEVISQATNKLLNEKFVSEVGDLGTHLNKVKTQWDEEPFPAKDSQSTLKMPKIKTPFGW